MLLYLQLWRQSSRDCAYAASTDSVLPKITHFEYDRGIKGILQAWSSTALYYLRTLCAFGSEKNKFQAYCCSNKRGLLGEKIQHGWINNDEFLKKYVCVVCCLQSWEYFPNLNTSSYRFSIPILTKKLRALMRKASHTVARASTKAVYHLYGVIMCCCWDQTYYYAVTP